MNTNKQHSSFNKVFTSKDLFGIIKNHKKNIILELENALLEQRNYQRHLLECINIFGDFNNTVINCYRCNKYIGNTTITDTNSYCFIGLERKLFKKESSVCRYACSDCCLELF